MVVLQRTERSVVTAVHAVLTKDGERLDVAVGFELNYGSADYGRVHWHGYVLRRERGWSCLGKGIKF